MKNKKIWLFGKVRELDFANVNEYEKALEEDIAQYFEGKLGDNIPVQVSVAENNLNIAIGLDCRNNIEANSIPQSIGIMLFGETENVRAEYPLPTVPSFGGYLNVLISNGTFLELYKKNVNFYKASRVKGVEITKSDTMGLIVKLIY